MAKVTDRMDRVSEDPFDKTVVWQSDPKGTIAKSSTGFRLFPNEGNGRVPRVSVLVTYIGEKWVFFDRVRFLADGNLVIDQEFSRDQVSRDVASGLVIENALFKVDDQVAFGAARLGKAKTALMRYSGERSFDRELSSEEKAYFSRMAEIYDDLAPLRGMPTIGIQRSGLESTDHFWRVEVSPTFEGRSDVALIKSAGSVDVAMKKVEGGVLAAPLRPSRLEAVEDQKKLASVFSRTFLRRVDVPAR